MFSWVIASFRFLSDYRSTILFFFFPSLSMLSLHSIEEVRLGAESVITYMNVISFCCHDVHTWKDVRVLRGIESFSFPFFFVLIRFGWNDKKMIFFIILLCFIPYRSWRICFLSPSFRLFHLWKSNTIFTGARFGLLFVVVAVAVRNKKINVHSANDRLWTFRKYFCHLCDDVWDCGEYSTVTISCEKMEREGERLKGTHSWG